MSAKKIGRPLTGEIIKDIDVKVRIDEHTNNLVLDYMKKHSTSKAEVIRRALNYFLIKVREETKKD